MLILAKKEPIKFISKYMIGFDIILQQLPLFFKLWVGFVTNISKNKDKTLKMSEFA